MRLLVALQSTRPASTREFLGLCALQIRRELLDLRRTRPARNRGLAQAELEPDPHQAHSEELDLWCCFHEEVDACLRQSGKSLVCCITTAGRTGGSRSSRDEREDDPQAMGDRPLCPEWRFRRSLAPS